MPQGNTGDDPKNENGQGPDAGQGQAQDGQAAITPAQMTPEQLIAYVGTLQASFEKTQKDLAKVTSEAAERRVALKKFEDEKAEQERQSMSDLQKAQADLASAKQALDGLTEQNRQLTLQIAFGHEAEKLKLQFATPQARMDAFKLADFTGTKIEAGEVSGMAEVLKTLQKEKPYLFSSSNQNVPDIDAQTGGRTSNVSASQAVVQSKREQSVYTGI